PSSGGVGNATLALETAVRGDLAKARAKFVKALEREPNNPTILNNLQLLNSSSRFVQSVSCAVAVSIRPDLQKLRRPATLARNLASPLPGRRAHGDGAPAT